MDYSAPTGSTDPNAPYVGKTSSTQGSKVPPHAVEYPQRELVNAELATGQTPSNNDLTQLVQAIATGIDLGAIGGTANALVDTIPGAVLIPVLRAGMTFFGTVLVTNTGPATLTLSGFGNAPGPKSIVKRDGTAISAGDLPAGVLTVFRFDGTSFRLLGLLPSDINALIANSAVGHNFVAFRSSGTFTWTAPAGVTQVFVEAWGGGGGGGGSGPGGAAGGGGSSGYTSGWVGVVPGTAYQVVVGQGGVGGASGSSATSGANGGTSAFGFPGNAFIAAFGGLGGSPAPTNGYVGGYGLPANSGLGGSNTLGGGGGQSGFFIGSVAIGGVGGAAPKGGATAFITTGLGISGNTPGGGGTGGANNSIGGPAGNGAVTLNF